MALRWWYYSANSACLTILKQNLPSSFHFRMSTILATIPDYWHLKTNAFFYITNHSLNLHHRLLNHFFFFLFFFCIQCIFIRLLILSTIACKIHMQSTNINARVRCGIICDALNMLIYIRWGMVRRSVTFIIENYGNINRIK